MGFEMQRANQAKLDRIAIMSLNFDAMLKIEGQQHPARTLDIMDLPKMIANRFGVHHVELQHAHLASTESAYLKALRDRVARAKSQLTQINLEFGVPIPTRRRRRFSTSCSEVSDRAPRRS